MTDSSPPVARRRKRGLILGVFVLAAAVGGYATLSPHPVTEVPVTKPDAGARPQPVTLAAVHKGEIPIVDQALGTVTPPVSVTLRTQIAGQLQQIAFQEGQLVQKGDFLAQIDPRPYQMTLEQAEGALQRDQALLKDARVNLERYRKLVAQDSISKQQLDTQESLVQQYEGAVLTDQGQIDAAKLNLTYCHITAPATGRVGLRQVDAGNYVQTSDANGIVVLTQLQPITVVFTLPEDQLPLVMKRLDTGAVLPVEAYDRTQSAKLAEGKLIAVDNQIDVSTGTVKLRAEFDNADNALFPNQFVNVRLRVDTLSDAIIAPQAAILRGVQGNFVYLVKEDHTVMMRVVKLGATHGDDVAITEGLAEGDKIVLEGTDKLRDGAKIKTPDAETSAPEPAPAHHQENK